MVGMLFRIQGTHKGNLFGIPATGKTIDVYELGIFRLAEGKITEAWFMADEAGVLLQLGAKLPLRSDGKLVVPPLTGVGADAEVVIKRLAAGSLATPEDRNRLLIARSKGVVPLPKENVAADFRRDSRRLSAPARVWRQEGRQQSEHHGRNAGARRSDRGLHC